MIIQCDKCATKFRLDDSRITPAGVKVRCTKCDNVFIVTPPPPPEEVQVEELFGVAPGGEKAGALAGAGSSGRQASKPKDDNRHLAFDFDSNANEEEEAFKASEKPEESFLGSGLDDKTSEEKGDAKKFSLDDLDFSFSEDRAASDKADEGWGSDTFAPPSEKAPSLERPADETPDFRVDFGEEQQEETKKDEKPDFDFGFDDMPQQKSEQSAEWPVEDEEAQESAPQKPAAENIISFQAAAAYAKDAKAPAAKSSADVTDDDNEAFKAVLSKTMDKDEPLTFDGPDTEDGEEVVDEEEFDEAPRRSQPKMGLIVAALIIVLGGGLIYFTGVIDRLAGLLMPPSSSEMKVVEIESMKGFYEENKNFGKVFVIDARVKNITNEPQEIKAATGIIYNDDGDKIAEKSVSPGRIVPIEDVRNLGREELERAFRDPSGGVIPAKGSVPVMVLFTDIPAGLSEFGIDVAR